MRSIQKQDPAIYDAMMAEYRRQQDELELIASENYASPAVIEAMGSVLTNKYAEGLPRRRYYGGCEHVDTVEEIARQRAKDLFGCVGANVQPHSGAQANAAVFLAVMEAGQTMLGLDLSHGGHLTHGSPVNSSGKLYRGVSYGLNEATGRLDYDQIRAIAKKERPRLIVCGASAYPRTIDFQAFRSIADEVDAVLLADIAHIAGLVATGHHPSPIEACHFVTTTTHKTLRGPRGGLIMACREWASAMNKAVFPGTQGGPLMHVIAAKAVAFQEASQADFKQYSQRVLDNASIMATRLQERGLTLVTDGTDNHLMLLDLGEHCSGKDAEDALGKAAITVNKNTVPGDKRSPFVTSGVRIGTPAMTTRGMRPEHALQVADWIADVIEGWDNEEVLTSVGAQVRDLCAQFRPYDEGFHS